MAYKGPVQKMLISGTEKFQILLADWRQQWHGIPECVFVKLYGDAFLSNRNGKEGFEVDPVWGKQPIPESNVKSFASLMRWCGRQEVEEWVTSGLNETE